MKLSREFVNGFIIFLGIGIYFFLMDIAGLSHIFWLRIFNAFIVVYGVNRTLKANVADGITGYNKNLLSAMLTSIIGAILSIGALLVYVHFKGGESYLKELPQDFIFGGGELGIAQYCIGLFVESCAATLIVSFCMMQYYKNNVEVINKVD